MTWQTSPQTLALVPGEVHLWQAGLDINEEEYNYLFALLSPEERQRAERYKFPIHRRRSVAARGRLRLILSKYVQIPPQTIQFQYGEHGKPYINSEQNKQKNIF